MKLPQFSEALNGKVIAITGAAGVLCSMLTEALCECGAKVALLDRTYEKAKEFEDKLTARGLVAKAYACNVLEPDSIKAAHEGVFKDFGPCGAVRVTVRMIPTPRRRRWTNRPL